MCNYICFRFDSLSLISLFTRCNRYNHKFRSWYNGKLLIWYCTPIIKAFDNGNLQNIIVSSIFSMRKGRNYVIWSAETKQFPYINMHTEQFYLWNNSCLLVNGNNQYKRSIHCWQTNCGNLWHHATYN